MNAYRIPDPEDLNHEEDVSGLPWGSFNMQYIVARGRESASQQGSRRASDQRPNETPRYPKLYSDGYGQTTRFDGRDSGGDDTIVYDEAPYFYDYENPSSSERFGYGHMG